MQVEHKRLTPRVEAACAFNSLVVQLVESIFCLQAVGFKCHQLRLSLNRGEWEAGPRQRLQEAPLLRDAEGECCAKLKPTA